MGMAGKSLGLAGEAKCRTASMSKGDVDVQGDIVFDELEVGVAEVMVDIVHPSGDQIVQDGDFVTFA